MIKRHIIHLKWILQKKWSYLTLYKLLLISTLIFLLGIWCWIIPIYYKKNKILEVQNRELSQAVNILNINKEQPRLVLDVADKLHYAIVVEIVSLHQLNLDEFKQLNTLNEKQFQIQITGTWLNVREFLEDFKKRFGSSVTIDSIEFNRNQSTNRVSLDLSITEIK